MLAYTASYFATLSLMTVSRPTSTPVIYVNKLTEIALSPVAHLAHSNREQYALLKKEVHRQFIHC